MAPLASPVRESGGLEFPDGLSDLFRHDYDTNMILYGQAPPQPEDGASPRPGRSGSPVSRSERLPRQESLKASLGIMLAGEAPGRPIQGLEDGEGEYRYFFHGLPTLSLFPSALFLSISSFINDIINVRYYFMSSRKLIAFICTIVHTYINKKSMMPIRAFGNIFKRDVTSPPNWKGAFLTSVEVKPYTSGRLEMQGREITGRITTPELSQP